MKQVNNLGFQIFNDQDLLHKQADAVVVFNHVIHADRCGGPCGGQRSLGRGCDGGPAAPPRPDPAPRSRSLPAAGGGSLLAAAKRKEQRHMCHMTMTSTPEPRLRETPLSSGH